MENFLVVIVLAADLYDVSIYSKREFRPYVSAITLFLPAKQIEIPYSSFRTLELRC